MPTVTAYENNALKEAAHLALSAYNFFQVTDGEQAPLSGLAALRALFVARTGPDQVYVEEQRKYLEDWDFAVVVLQLVDADVSGSDTNAAMQGVFIAFDSASLSFGYLSQVHYQR
jgi:hypothetical protein